MNILKDRQFLIGLVVILALGSFLRLYNLGETPFVADEFLDVNATYGHFKTGEWQAWDFNIDAPSVRDNKASDERAWVYRSQISWLYNVLPPEEWAIRLVSALWSIATILIIVVVTYSWTRNPWIALIAGFLWAVSVPAIEQGRKIRMYSMFAPIFLLFTWSLYAFLVPKTMPAKKFIQSLFSLSYWHAAPTVLLGLLAFHLHPLTGTIVFGLLAFGIVMAWTELREMGRIGKFGAYTALLISGLIAAFIIFPEQWKAFSGLLTFFKSNTGYLSHLGTSYWHPMLALGLGLYGTYALYRDTETRIASIWISSIFCAILMSAMFLWKRNIGAQYIYFLQPLAMILIAAGTVTGFAYLRDHLDRKVSTCLGIVALLIFLPNYPYFFQENNTYHITSRAETPNYRKVFDYVKTNTTDETILITRNLRNYYYGGLGIPVQDFGSERDATWLADEGKVPKITLQVLKELEATNTAGWFVYTDNDEEFLSTEARNYATENFQRVTDSPLIRGKIFVYKWGSGVERKK